MRQINVNNAWEHTERRMGPSLSTLTARRRRRQLWPLRRRRCLLYPLLLLPRFTALTLWAATSVLVASLPYRVDRALRAAHAPSPYPLVETEALRVPGASTRQWQQLTSCLRAPHTLPHLRCPPTSPRCLYPPVLRARPYVPHHYRKTTSLTLISCLVPAGRRWMTWKARGAPEP
jgi:hypothetical protein